MKLKEEDKALLKEMCDQSKVSYQKVLKLLDTVKEYEFKDRRTGIYDTLRDIIRTEMK